MKNLMNLINNITIVDVVENPETNEINITGKIETSEVRINLHLGIAPSLQSTLSRGGHVSCSASVKVDGVTAYYTSDLSTEEKTEIGGWISVFQRKEDLHKQAMTYSKIEHLI